MSSPKVDQGVVEVDVIVPVRDVVQFLDEAIESALDQGSVTTRVLVVDDASLTQVAIADDFIRSGRVALLRSDDRLGIGGARNIGVSVTASAWLAFLDGDDLWPTHHCAALLGAMSHRDVFASGRVEHFADASANPALRVPQGAAHGILAGSTIMAREAFRAVGGFRPHLRVGEFVDLMARGIDTGWTGGRTEEVVLRRRVHSDHASRREPASQDGYLQVVRDQLRRTSGVDS